MRIYELNPILYADSYKFGHYLQTPPDMGGVSQYLSARKNTLPFSNDLKTLQVVGQSMLAQRFLDEEISDVDIEEAEPFIRAHGLEFNRKGFEDIVNKNEGHWPVSVYAVPEGMNVPFGVPILRVDSPREFNWVGPFLETKILPAIWYPSTVATISKFCKNIIYRGLKESSEDPDGQIGFKLHDFGFRGASSRESASIGGLAHLTNFLGTDTVGALIHARNYYDADMAGFSINAAEHFTITSWGRENEVEAYRNMIRQFGKPGALFAVVSDAYNLRHAVDIHWGQTLKEEVQKSGATVVIRPDSGDPVTQVISTLTLLAKHYGYTTNKLGYNVLNNMRVIQGDGIDPQMIRRIVDAMILNKFSVDNVAFGMGGALLQKLDRDTFSFAMKCSAAEFDGEWKDVYKDPVDGGKSSLKGRQLAILDKSTGKITAQKVGDVLPEKHINLMVPIYSRIPGEQVLPLRRESLDKVRARTMMAAEDAYSLV